jgi:putative PIG3 family NAD(P)H quinone oxidoreductase
MHAITVGEGPDHNLEWQEVLDPEPGQHEVVVEIHGTAVNRADLLQRRGNYPPPPGASPYLGLEMAGVVTSLGPTARDCSIGDRVFSILGGGGYAEAVAADSRYLMQLPAALSFVEGGAAAEVFLTAYVNLFIEAGLQPGETLLVHGGASGVGTAAIQLATRAGATVCVTARSEAKLAACRELGAASAINHTDGDWVAAVREATAGGVDVILDCVGGAYLAGNLAALRDRGRLVCIGLLGGATAELALGELLRRRLRVIGSVLRTRTPAEKAAISSGFVRDFGAALGAREILPVLHQTLPIQRAADAHDLVESYGNIGKVALRVR